MAAKVDDKVLKFESGLIDKIEHDYITPWLYERRYHVAMHQVNHAFLNGHQYITHENGKVSSLPNNKNRVRMVNNLFIPAYRVMMAQLNKNPAEFDLTPMSEGFTEEASTLAGRKLIKGVQRGARWHRATRLAWRNKLLGGLAGIRVGWNEEGGAMQEVDVEDKDGNPILLDLKDDVERPLPDAINIIKRLIEQNPDLPEQKIFEARFEPVKEPGRAGEIFADAYSLMEILGDSPRLDLAESEIYFTQRARTMDYFRSTFPERGHLVKPEQRNYHLFGAQTGVQTLPGLGMPRVTGGSRRRGQREYAIEWEMYVRPREHNPILAKYDADGKIEEATAESAEKGIHFVWANGIALTPPDNPAIYYETPETDLHDTEFDMIDYRWLESEGFYPPNFFTDLVSLQQSFNRHRSQIKEIINAYIYPKTLVPHGSRLRSSNEGAWADVAGEILEYTGVPPSYLQPPSVPSYVFRDQEMEIQQFNDISMLHEITRQGKVPPQVRTASGLERLHEQDIESLIVHMQSFEESEETAGQKLLDRAQQFYSEDRIVSYLGERNRLEVMEFKRSDFFSNDWKVFVHRGSTIPQSRATRTQQTYELLQTAPMIFVNDQTGQFDKARFARYAGLEDIEEFYQDINESVQAAQSENVLLDKGQPVEVFPYEDDAVHLEEHYKVIRSPDFKAIKPQEIQQVFLEHMSAHEQALQQKQQQSSQAAAQLQAAAQAGQEAVNRQSGANAAAAEARGAVEQALDNAMGERGMGGEGGDPIGAAIQTLQEAGIIPGGQQG